ncbi:MAG: hypothetical protein JSW39_00950 [Desulfobacterales bacterium]|nr:MAG: hypothetical protein JSW39_00950 [Desulfobacterales bacterium]
MQQVDNLKHITLSLAAGTTPEIIDRQPRFSAFEFIFGLSAAGMTPFEYVLVGKTEGDEVLLRVNQQDIPHTFEHLCRPLMDLCDGREAFFLKAKILKVRPADSREVVKALAQMAAHGDGDCGCGCGGSCGC